MKKHMLALAFAAALPSVASAVPATWTDSIDFTPDIYLSTGHSYSYTHDINDAGFNPFEDLVTNYRVQVGLSDDRRDPWYASSEWVYVSQPGLSGDVLQFNVNDVTLGVSLLGLVQLNTLGQLSITVTSLLGDFYLTDSLLTARGEDNTTAVPEPTTLGLLGLGLLGLGMSRRRLQQSAE